MRPDLPAKFSAADLTISFGGGGNILVKAAEGGHITLNPITALDILNSGGNQGLFATGVGSQIDATGVSIDVVGGGDLSVHSKSGAAINLASSTVDVSGNGGETAVLVEGSHSTVSAENTRIFMIFGGGGDDAVRATTGGVATLEGGSVGVQGAGGGEKGLVADGATSAVVATGTAITISGAGGDIGASAVNGGSIILDGGTVARRFPCGALEAGR